jgi:hypothetical protein
MADADHLLSEFIAADRAGSTPDPLAYLARSEEPQRARLEELIDDYLAHAPRRRFDASAFAASPARGIADELSRVILGQGGSWPTVLPALRHRAQLKRAELVARLAAALGAGGQEAKVGAYYHAMEQGTLPAAGVSLRVLEALGAIVAESADRLRAAGRELGLGEPPAPAAAMPAAFARVAQPNPGLIEGDDATAGSAAESPDHDFVDDLFTGGESERT